MYEGAGTEDDGQQGSRRVVSATPGRTSAHQLLEQLALNFLWERADKNSQYSKGRKTQDLSTVRTAMRPIAVVVDVV